jgi:hypothetical protein
MGALRGLPPAEVSSGWTGDRAPRAARETAPLEGAHLPTLRPLARSWCVYPPPPSPRKKDYVSALAQVSRRAIVR